MSSKSEAKRVLRLPREGRLLVCTDLHGHLRDFRRIREIFVQTRALGPCQLLFTGDLIHGPNYEEDHWPPRLGGFYPDESHQLVDEVIELQSAWPGQVHCLLGNHEHSHIGGPHTPKFWLDETAHFESGLDPERVQRYHEWFRSLPLVAVTGCGVAITHAAPNLGPNDVETIEQWSYDGYERMRIDSVEAMPPLGRMLWSRRCAPPNIQSFLHSLSTEESPLRIVVYGHDVVSEGYLHFGKEQVVLSTSFGLPDSAKRYLDLDLSASYGKSHDLVVGREIQLLYSDAPDRG